MGTPGPTQPQGLTQVCLLKGYREIGWGSLASADMAGAMGDVVPSPASAD